ncbi:MAG: hypothetical protein J5874_05995 [Oscillospiraceae bacterium]|nr:hypothetical protein [Oscillospiraceae bacterium]
MRRITLFCGHYGSGKTNIAVNYAFYIRSKGFKTAIVDLDIVNPYFRTKDSEKELEKCGIRVISLPFANSNVDLPSIPSESYSVFSNKDEYAVFDIGGDDSGAYVLGQFEPYIKAEKDFDNFYVANFSRPLTRNAEEALGVMREIELAGKVPFTGIINNTNLGEETEINDILLSNGEALRLSKISNLPLVMTTVREDLAKDVKAENIFPLKLQKKYW